ncbi:unnamed protein product [Leuciscus chuanchicus]
MMCRGPHDPIWGRGSHGVGASNSSGDFCVREDMYKTLPAYKLPGLNNSKIKHLEDLPGRPNDQCGVLQGPVGNPPKYETPTSPTNPLFVRLPTIVDKCPVDPTAGLKPRPRPTNPLFVRLPTVVAKCPVDPP